MSLFGKKDKIQEEESEVKNPIEEFKGNKDFSVNTYVNNSENKNINSNNSTMTTISNNAAIEGIIKAEGDITINGRIKGSVTIKGKAILGPNGLIEGDLLAQNAELSGKVNGKVEIVEMLYLKGSARINGDIYTNKLVVEKDASFNGKCIMQKDNTPSVTSQVDVNAPKGNTLKSDNS